jgi:2-polyprenyl-3-methyl-5-hydroxy-6-metoxy-1,4-benzoquinol methylase
MTPEGQVTHPQLQLFATPKIDVSLADCYFYHVMEVPGIGLVGDEWDLRQGVDSYLGNLDFFGARVLEIGPASGFLTVEMERRGANVVAVEIPDDPGWDFVPYPASVLQPILGPRKATMTKIKNSFWYIHKAFSSRSTLIYGHIDQLAHDLGHFDIALIGSVLLHCGNPLHLISECAKRADIIVISDMYYPELEGQPICRLRPTAENLNWHTWWEFSTDMVMQFLAVIGFRSIRKSINGNFFHRGRAYKLFTIVASKRLEEGVHSSIAAHI